MATSEAFIVASLKEKKKEKGNKGRVNNVS